ncbi:MAG TPA: ParB/RepB/Spo0J family partition protein [Candidatus Limnocylindrales bacterium]|nr:ParB/RepB/Spo0J family partition protein [Candidatus Limnocylindrales bacterium]
MARPDFRAAAARRLSEERELSPAIVSLLSPDGPTRSVGVRIVHVDRIEANPEQPRLAFNQETLDELAASIREHGVLQPILVRPLGQNTYQLIAGERRWRASKQAGLETIPALIEDIDDDTALEISIIENLQREDISPLDEAAMYDRMVTEHGYSIRKLADKLGKDKGYVENRLRLADAPDEVRELVSLRKDTLSHAYELMKVQDPKRRRRLADQVARGELTLIKLRDKIEGRRTRAPRSVDGVNGTEPTLDLHPNGDAEHGDVEELEGPTQIADEPQPPEEAEEPARPRRPLSEDSLVNAKSSLADALDELVNVLRSPDAIRSIPDVDRDNLAKYLTISKLRLENAIALVRSGDTFD